MSILLWIALVPIIYLLIGFACFGASIPIFSLSKSDEIIGAAIVFVPFWPFALVCIFFILLFGFIKGLFG